MLSAMAVPVTVVTGFLGAGKTTLVNALARNFAVIVNEHGEVGIDGELLQARAVVEINGGCICCTTRAELVRALEETAAQRPARIVVETSGAASPAGVLRAVAAGGRAGTFALDGVLTVVDGTRIEKLVAHDLALEQIGYADVVVLARGDQAPVDAEERILAWNGAATVVRARHGVVEGAPSLVALLARRAGLPREVPAASAHVYESVSLVLEGEVDGERFADFVETELASVAGRIFRTKGILAVTGVEERMIVQGVGDGVEITFGEPWGTAPRRCRLVVVGFGLERERLARAFAACAGDGLGDPARS